MLYIIGLGVGTEADISLKGMEACEKADEVYVELYTARWQGDLEKLGRDVKKKITLLERNDMEEGSKKFVRKAMKKDVALLVPGDPLSATTHLNLLMDARKHKVRAEIIHASSILTAVAETGLSLYNFGKTVTIVRPQKGYAPTSFYDTAVENRKLGMHTLLLLDVDMDTGEGIEILMGIEQQKKKDLVNSDTLLVAAAGLGTGRSNILYDRALELLKKPLEPPSVLIIPGKMHFTEEEWLKGL